MLWEFPSFRVIIVSLQTAVAHTTSLSLGCILTLTDPLLVAYHTRGNGGFFLMRGGFVRQVGNNQRRLATSIPIFLEEAYTFVLANFYQKKHELYRCACMHLYHI
jgi:hypothetical protein